MPEDMSLSVNGQSRVPPGFRFHPTEEELLHYYLRKKVAYQKIDLDVIREVDLNKLEPWDIQEKCKIGSGPQNDWYFFSHKDKKYPTGTRTNRATAVGFWKATGRDKIIHSSFKRIGMRKTLVFYKGRAPHGQKSDWIMHEYRLDDNTTDTKASNSTGEMTQEDGWVVCRVFKKKNHYKTVDNPSNSSIMSDTNTQMLGSSNDGSLDQILEYMGRTSCKEESETSKNIKINMITSNNNNNNNKHIIRLDYGVHERFKQLQELECPTLPPILNDCRCLDQVSSSQVCYQPIDVQVVTEAEASVTSQGSDNLNSVYNTEPGPNDWVSLDRLIASHLNGQTDTSKQLACLNDPNPAFYSTTDHDLQILQVRSANRLYHSVQDYNSEIDLWSFIRPS